MKTLTPRRVKVSELQADIFAPPEPIDRPTQPRAGKHHSGGRPTEVAAALRIAPKSGTQRFEILRLIANAGFQGMTADELEHKGHKLQSICGRRKELEEAGYVEATERTRIASTGSAQSVWIATERGRRFIRDAARRRAS